MGWSRVKSRRPVELLRSPSNGSPSSKATQTQHLRFKKHTQAIESFHATVRHYLARFHRKTHCYSKSSALVRATLNLFFFRELAISIIK